jgi:hypothetical protein
MNKKPILVILTLAIIWGASTYLIIAPDLGLANPIYPRPQPDYALIIMIISAIMLSGYSIKTGINIIKTR